MAASDSGVPCPEFCTDHNGPIALKIDVGFPQPLRRQSTYPCLLRLNRRMYRLCPARSLVWASGSGRLPLKGV